MTFDKELMEEMKEAGVWQEKPPKESHRDLIITWRQDRPLESYLEELTKAHHRNQVINFRVATLPKDGFLDWCGRPHRCYVTYKGWIRGYNDIIGFQRREEGEVIDPITGEAWSAGNYIVRDPIWYPKNKLRVKSPFRGWQYFTDKYEEDLK